MRDIRMVASLCGFLMSVAPDPASGQQPPSGSLPSPAPVVEAVELDGVTIRGGAEGDEAPPAGHPPIHTIPPMPMPVRDAADATESTAGMGVAVSFDPATGAETRAPASAPGHPASPNPTLEDGYVGAYDQQEIQNVPATFGNMSLISPSRRGWRRGE